MQKKELSFKSWNNLRGEGRLKGAWLIRYRRAHLVPAQGKGKNIKEALFDLNKVPTGPTGWRDNGCYRSVEMKSQFNTGLMAAGAQEMPPPCSKRSHRERRFGVGTMDTTSKGMRCQAAQDIRVCGGMVKHLALGTIVFELVGGDSHLVNVYWDQGIDTLVLPEDIVVAERDIVWH